MSRVHTALQSLPFPIADAVFEELCAKAQFQRLRPRYDAVLLVDESPTLWMQFNSHIHSVSASAKQRKKQIKTVDNAPEMSLACG
ncbi:MAG: hypothetical protein J2P25_13795 [Nocardiopsaceae bacterium]|nr:hypothetical protein [Nocardiopsaceae bacterium]